MKICFACLVVLISCHATCFAFDSSSHPTLPIGSQAPAFNLPGTDGKTYTLNSFRNVKVLAIIFTCNHCPTAQAYEDRIIKLTSDYKDKGVAVVAIMPNDPKSVNLDELGYTDLGDSFEEMKIRAAEKQFNFPYLYDGETEAVSRQYGPVATPHIFIFDKDRKLRYSGRIDDVEKPLKTPNTLDARNAIEALLNDKDVVIANTKVFGCSVKWAEKEGWKERAAAQWSVEPVSVDTIGINGIKDLIKNNSDKLRVINVWATWCGPCVAEFSEFIAMNHMYRRRDFELITISADDPDNKEKVLKFLKKEQASNTNYIFNTDNKYKLIDAVDAKWEGALPYTLIVEPGGKIIYAKQGEINPSEVKKKIVDDPYIGRYY